MPKTPDDSGLVRRTSRGGSGSGGRSGRQGDRPHYPEISPRAYEHPSDRAATSALGSIPLLDTILKKLSELRFERAFQQMLLADAVRLGPTQRPDLWDAHLGCLDSLDMAARPQLYLSSALNMNAMTVGSSRPIVIVNSGLVRQLGPDEVAAVLAHEDGHVLSEHVHYATVLAILQRLLRTGISPIGLLPLRAVALVLLEWYRCAELSCDRAAALVTGDPRVVYRVLMGTAGGGVDGLNLDAFIEQARDYHESDDLLARPGRFLSEITRTHPFAVKRVNELVRWVEEGDFDRIRSGDYLRRGEQAPVTDHVRAAAEHYRQRFTEIIDRVAGGAQKVFNQVTSQVTSWFGFGGRDDRDHSDDTEGQDDQDDQDDQ